MIRLSHPKRGHTGSIARGESRCYRRDGWPGSFGRRRVDERRSRKESKTLAAALTIAASLLSVATSPEEPPVYCEYQPVYLTYENLRQPVAGRDAVPLGTIGKIFLYGNLILVNSKNKGVHVIDDSNPAGPENRLFIPIPGNIDMAVKDGILYADSYVDLVAVDMRDLQNVREVKRIQSVFPYDPYQSIGVDDTAYVCGYDQNKGVVVGVTRAIPARGDVR